MTNTRMKQGQELSLEIDRVNNNIKHLNKVTSKTLLVNDFILNIDADPNAFMEISINIDPIFGVAMLELYIVQLNTKLDYLKMKFKAL